MVKTKEVKEVVKEVKEKEIEYPEVAGTGLFQVVQVESGFVVYNPAGQRASGVMDDRSAKEIAHANNIAAHLKPTKH